MDNKNKLTPLGEYLINYQTEPFDFEWNISKQKPPQPHVWKEIDSMQFPENSWLVRNLFPKEGVSILASISGEGKSWVAMHLAKCVSDGSPFFNHEGFKTEKTRVLYINLEMPVSELQRRGRLINLDSGNDNLLILNEDDFNLSTGSDDDLKYKWLLNFIYNYKIEAVIIDTFRAAAGGVEEDRAHEIRKFFQKFQILKNSGVSLIFLEHTRKSNPFEGKAPKLVQVFGSIDKVASADVVNMIRTDEISRNMFFYQRKNRGGNERVDFEAKIEDVFDTSGRKHIEFRYIGSIEDDSTKKDEAKEIIKSHLTPGESKTTNELLEIAGKLVGQKNLRLALRELVSDGVLESSKRGKQNLYFQPKGEEKGDVEVNNGNFFDDS